MSHLCIPVSHQAFPAALPFNVNDSVRWSFETSSCPCMVTLSSILLFSCSSDVFNLSFQGIAGASDRSSSP